MNRGFIRFSSSTEIPYLKLFIKLMEGALKMPSRIFRRWWASSVITRMFDKVSREPNAKLYYHYLFFSKIKLTWGLSLNRDNCMTFLREVFKFLGHVERSGLEDSRSLLPETATVETSAKKQNEIKTKNYYLNFYLFLCYF